jgi:hypothetical protein
MNIKRKSSYFNCISSLLIAIFGVFLLIECLKPNTVLALRSAKQTHSLISPTKSTQKKRIQQILPSLTSIDDLTSLNVLENETLNVSEWTDLGDVASPGTFAFPIVGTDDGLIVGGKYGANARYIFKYDIDSTEIAYSIVPVAGGNIDAMVQGDGTTVFATVSWSSNQGVLIEYDSATNTSVNRGTFIDEYGHGLTKGLDGKIYVGSCCNGRLSIYDPQTQQWNYKNRIIANQTRISGLTTSTDGKIYGVTSRIWVYPYGDASLFSFDPNTQTTTVIGTIWAGAHEAWNIAYNPFDGRIYGIVEYGMTARLFAYDPSKPQLGIQDLGPAIDGVTQLFPGNLVIADDGKVHLRVGANLLLYDPAHSGEGIINLGPRGDGGRPLAFGADGHLYGVNGTHLLRNNAINNCAVANSSLQPLLLVPGWGAADTIQQDNSAFANVLPLLEDKGYRLNCNLFYAGETSARKTLLENAHIINETLCEAYSTVERIKPGWTGHFDIIGHSYGGLRARAFLEFHDDIDFKFYGAPCFDSQGELRSIQVDNLFTLGSPHGGSRGLLPGAFVIGASHINLDIVSIPQLFFMENYNSSHSQPEDICYRLIGGNAMNQYQSFEGVIQKLYKYYQDNPNDLGVYLDSALELINWPDKYPNVVAISTDDMHGYEERLGFKEIDSFFVPTTTISDTILPYLGADVSQCKSETMIPLASTGYQSQTATTPSFIIASDQIQSGATHTGTFEITDSGNSSIYLNWPSGDLEFSLTDPDGTLINPITSISNQNVDYVQMSLMANVASYAFTDTLSGKWNYTINGTNLSYITPYQLVMLPSRPIAVSAEISSWQKQAQSTIISGTLTYSSTTPISGADVKAIISRPDGTIDTITLFDDGLHQDLMIGDGIYGNSYTNTNQGGYYGLVVQARGIYETSPFTRTAENVFSVASNAVSLAGQYADRPRDVNGNGQYEGLEIDIDVEVTEVGTYTLAADLMAADGTYIGHSLLISDLVTGTQTLNLFINGQDIYESGKDGPYLLTNIMLLDAKLDGLLLDRVDMAYTTNAYTHQQFALFQPEIINIERPNSTVFGRGLEFTSTVFPYTSTMPLTYIWEATDQSTITFTSSITASTIFTWTEPGVKNITVTASNEAGSATRIFQVDVTTSLPETSINKSDNDIVHIWPDVGDFVDHYEVWRGLTFNALLNGDAHTIKLIDLPPLSNGTLIFTDTNVISNEPKNYFYLVRSISTGNTSADSNVTGLINIPITPGWNLLNLPLLTTDVRLDQIVGVQLSGTHDPQTADRVWVWDGDSQTYTSAWFCGGLVCESWGEPYANHWLDNSYNPSPIILDPDQAFWIQNKSGVPETLVLFGDVAETDRTVLIGQGWQMLGSAFPIEKTLDETNIPANGTEDPLTADRIWVWDAETQAYQSAWYCGGPICESWGPEYYQHWLANDYTPTNIVLEAGHGFWYQNKGGLFVWNNITP